MLAVVAVADLAVQQRAKQPLAEQEAALELQLSFG